MILAHFHGFIDRASLPHNVAFFGQDKAPLPCGSVEAAAVTVEGKNAIAERALAHPQDIDYLGACFSLSFYYLSIIMGMRKQTNK